MRRVRLLVCSLWAVAACGSPVDEGAQAPSLLGTWSYTATQVTPAADLNGTLTVFSQEGATFDARIEVRERDAFGNVRNRSASVSGRTLGADGVDFDAFLDGSVRRHVGRLMGDSLSGAWAESEIPPLTGTFRARRIR